MEGLCNFGSEKSLSFESSVGRSCRSLEDKNVESGEEKGGPACVVL